MVDDYPGPSPEPVTVATDSISAGVTEVDLKYAAKVPKLVLRNAEDED